MTKPLDPPAALRPLDAIRADLEHPHTAALLAVRASVGDGPIGRLLRDVEPFVDALAAVERERDNLQRVASQASELAKCEGYAKLDTQVERDAALARIAAVEAEALQAIKNVPRRSGTAEWSKGAAVAQAAGFDVGLATASDAVASAFTRAALAASPTPTTEEQQ